MKQMSQAAVERAMKLQDVMLRAMAKRITWYQAAEILRISCRQMQRWKTRFAHEGYEGLFDRRRGIPSPKRVPLATVEEVLRLYQEQYFDFNVRHFHEKLKSEHQIELSYTWVKQALQGAGLVKPQRKRGKYRKRRPRRPLPGMLLHIDASQHRWFCDDRWYDLLVIMDDATSEIYYAQLVEEESTRTVMAALRQVIERQGVFCALYSDRASHFFLTPKADEPVDHARLTQVGRALRLPECCLYFQKLSEIGFVRGDHRLPQVNLFHGYIGTLAYCRTSQCVFHRVQLLIHNCPLLVHQFSLFVINESLEANYAKTNTANNNSNDRRKFLHLFSCK